MKQLLILLLLTSCINSNTIKEELLQLTSKSIELPKNGQIVVDGKDSTISNYFVSEYKLVVYTDSLGCHSCALNGLHVWNDLIEYTKRYKDKVKFYFIFNPPKLEDVRFAIKNNFLAYPILIDTLGEFERLNSHLPNNSAMHTFLLDQNNDVILVGSPLHNSQIEKLFKEELSKRLD